MIDIERGGKSVELNTYKKGVAALVEERLVVLILATKSKVTRVVGRIRLLTQSTPDDS